MTATVSPLSANGYPCFTLPDREPSVFDHVLRFDLIWRESQVSCSSGVRRGAMRAGTKGTDGDLDGDNRRTVFGWQAEAHLL